MNTQKSVLDFITVCAEYCAFVEKVEQLSKKSFIEKSQKILTLLYLKASLLQPKQDVEGYCEQFVTEEDWNFIKDSIETKLGTHESFLDVVEPDNYENSEKLSISISECFADIYQDIRDFIERYKEGTEEVQDVAIYECSLNFKLIWGPRLLSVVQELHSLLYASNSTIDQEEE